MELQRGQPEFEAAGVWVAAVSYDPVGDLAQFCDEHGITFEFLSDPGSRVIHGLGILNTLIESDEPLHGIPFPGAYLLDEGGVVVAKYFHREYQVREAAAFVLADGFGLTPRLDGYPRVAAQVDGTTLEVTLGAEDLKFRQRVHLYIRVTPGAEWALARPVEVVVTGPESLEIGPVRRQSDGDVRVELLSAARDVESVPVDARVDWLVRDPAGAGASEAARTTILHLELPVGELNRARRGG